MTRLGVLLLGMGLLGAAGCDDDAAAPSNLPLVFTAPLSPANEVPPVSNAESTGSGAVQITFNVTRDSAGVITAGTADFHFQLSGFPASMTIVGAHIHPGAAGVNGPVIVNTGVVAASALSAVDGVVTFTVSGINVAAATLEAIAGNPAGYYFNVHSPANPGGVARGQLRRVL